MKIFNLITVEEASKYGQYYLEANYSIFRRIEMRPRIIKTSDIVDIIPLSDIDIKSYIEEEREEVETVIKECLHKYFYIKVEKPLKAINGDDSFLIFVKGDLMEFMKLMHIGGHFKA
jgi:hypothetical protein